MAAKLSIGYLLNEIINPVTGDTFASFEPALDYVVAKIPKWPFDKFPAVERKLGTQMKATGEVMGIDRNLERALLKAIHSLEIDVNDLKLPALAELSLEDLQKKLLEQTDESFFVIFELLRRGITIEELHKQTGIDLFFLQCFKLMIEQEKEISSHSLETVTKDQLQYWKEKGFSDRLLLSQWGVEEKGYSCKKKRMVHSILYIKWLIHVPLNLKLNLIIFIPVILVKMNRFQVIKEKWLLLAAVQFELGRELSLIIVLFMVYLH